MIGVGLSLYSGSKTLLQRAMDVLRSFPGASSYPFSTLQGAYQTNAGPAAAAVNDPIGLELDAMGTVGPELVTNGDFSAGSTGWNLSAQWSVSAGAAHRSGVGWGTLTRPGTCSAGKMYKIEGDIVYTSGLLQIYGCEGEQVLINDGGHFVGWMTAGAIGGNFNIGSSDFVGSVTNISVKEVTGNHATQSTAINRPTVQRGLFNYLSQSSNFASGDWIAASSGTYTVSTDAVAGPYDGTTADVITASPTGLVYVTETPNLPAGKFTEAVWVKLISGSGSVILNLAGTIDAGTALTGDWQLLVFTNPADLVAGFKQISFILPNSSVVAVYSAGLFQGTLTAAQILQQGGIPLTTSAAGSNPTAGPVWARFNGTNQSMALSSVPFQMADDFAVVACVNLSTAGASSTIFLITGVGYVQLPWLYFDAAGHVKVTLYDGTNAFEFASAATFVATTIVVSLVKIGNAFRLRVNGVQVGTLTATMLSPSVTLSSMGAFDNGGVSSVLPGAIYDLDVIKGTVTDAQLLVLEKAAAQRAGITL